MVKPESFEICPSASLSAQITSFQLSQFPTILEKLVCHFATPEPESVPLLHRRANKEGEYSTGFPFLGLCDDWEAFQNGNQPPLCGRREAGKGSEYCMHSARFIADVFKCAEGLSGRRIVMHSCHWPQICSFSSFSSFLCALLLEPQPPAQVPAPPRPSDRRGGRCEPEAAQEVPGPGRCLTEGWRPKCRLSPLGDVLATQLLFVAGSIGPFTLVAGFPSARPSFCGAK